jgi:hypothetical protein
MPKKAFDQQKNESAQAYQSAKLYFEMGADRSIEEVSQKLAKSVPFLKRLSSAHNWVERARAYDEYLAAIQQEEAEKREREQANVWVTRRAQIREEGFKNAELLIERAKEMLLHPLTEQTTETKDKDGKIIITIIKPAGWRARDAAMFLKIANELQRLSADMETVIQKNIDDVDFESAIEQHMKEFKLTRAEAIKDLAQFLPEMKTKYADVLTTNK